ncbi:trypsin-like serine peptidase [Nonomuraea spiralis]|uniref:Trypsin-like serine peptidase n=1 Tax=Nonomuraea spiralis TaxID=46182 RepID=A0ABV5IM78_9ACTN|nr:trypsin-like peptidase domain-containing protein [Nonomuraea spiralis]GGT01169.1 peptidase [Nonomuraea spiralis]
MHRRVVLLSVVALTVAGAPAPAQAGTTADRGPVGWSGAGSSAERRTVMDYWTPERMRAARPLSAPEPRRGTSGEPTQGTPWAARGVAATRRITTSSWTGSAAATTRQAAPSQDSKGQTWADGGGVARTVGRVFFTTAQGRTASCSGTAVTSANQSVVLTAGHCVKADGAAHRNWVFVPGFDDGRRPFGTWVATRLLTTQQWNAREDINFDVAAAVVAPLQGRTLTDVVGGQGVAFNQPVGRQLFSFGYPAAAPFDGSDLTFCSGRGFKDPVRTQDQGLRCAMTGGSSGGPWFQGFDTSTGLGWLNSVNSFKYDFAPDFMFGPFFGNEAMAVYQAAQRSGAA